MSSPVWDVRRANARQSRRQRPWLRKLRAQGISWPPRVGDVVCDCRFLHSVVVQAWPEYDDYEMADGMTCGLGCLDPLDHHMDDHPPGYRSGEQPPNLWRTL